MATFGTSRGRILAWNDASVVQEWRHHPRDEEVGSLASDGVQHTIEAIIHDRAMTDVNYGEDDAESEMMRARMRVERDAYHRKWKLEQQQDPY